MAINPITLTGIQSAQPVGGAAGAQKTQDKSGVQGFGQTLSSALDNLSQMQTSSDQAMQKLAAGETIDLHQVMISAEQTDIAFRVALSLRDKLVEAYQEVMRMQV
ncbi:MAG: flagellar hook-basal body complex protein FliE [Chloroflexota bacterium]